ncbi:MAG TPA: molybdopterin molybdenumtransferase MoeA [Lachnospiraceae bacterium]|nr:molybdopterin molybdenumtransferase MoeA [Lachnospiraceae bacterium]
MRKSDYKEASEILLENITPVKACPVRTENAFGRILAEAVTAKENVPDFRRSPYDGYAFRAADTEKASPESPVKLRVTERLKAGQVPRGRVDQGTAVRLMTGAMIPEGADAVCKYEDTVFTGSEVYVKRAYSPGENVISEGEDIKRGDFLSAVGDRADAGLLGAAASLGLSELKAYRRPVAALFSTGDEICETDEELKPGKIRNSNRYIISAALEAMGIDTVYLGNARDEMKELLSLLEKGEGEHDILISTGGVSVGDYDLVPEAMEKAGYRILVRGVDMKPGMACAYGLKAGKLMLALSGNPASALTNLQCVCAPALRRLAGMRVFRHRLMKMKPKEAYHWRGSCVRFIRGRLEYEEGQVLLSNSGEQGNIVISSAIGCNAYGMIPGEVLIPAGGLIEGFMTDI